MSGVDIHPEELFDKLASGELTAGERARLMAHVERCAVCRFELQLRADIDEDVERRTLTEPPQLLTELPTGERGRRVRRWSLAWGWAAAIFVLAAGAVASYAAPRVFSRSSAASSASAGTPSAAGNRARPSAHRLQASVETRPAALSAVTAAAQGLAASNEPAGTSSHSQRPDAPLNAGVSQTALAAASPSPALVVAGHAYQGSSRASGEGSHALHADSHFAADAPLVHSEAGGGSNAATPASPAVSAATLFSAANQARRGGDLAQAGLLYRALQQQFPRSSEAQLSRVTLGTLLLNSDPLAALSSFDAYLRSGAQPLAAEALVGRARALRALGRRSEAQAAWQEVVARYPNSLYAKQARDTLSAAAPP